MDLYIDQDCLTDASRSLMQQRTDILRLKGEIEASFTQLKVEWDSEAGKLFFQKFEDDLIKNLERYATVFEYMSKNLSTASQKYDEVFRAADAVASAQY